MTDLSYDVDPDSEFQEGTGEEYDSLIQALNGLPDTLEIRIDMSNLSQDADPLGEILKQANAQTGLPIKNAKIFDVKDVEEN